MTDPKDAIQYLKGRGAQFNPKNRFLKHERVKEHIEALATVVAQAADERQQGPIPRHP